MIEALTIAHQFKKHPQSSTFCSDMHCVMQSQASLFWAISRMGMRPSRALLDKASLVLQSKEIEAQVWHRPIGHPWLILVLLRLC